MKATISSPKAQLSGFSKPATSSKTQPSDISKVETQFSNRPKSQTPIPTNHATSQKSTHPNLVTPQNPKPYRFRRFLRDKTYFLVLALVVTVFIGLFLSALRVRAEIIIVLAGCWIIFLSISLLIEYRRKYRFYHDLTENIRRLDQAYLVLETLPEPTFYDGQILYDALYQIDKSMAENVQNYRISSQEFQEYVEMWIHEVKTPLATLAVISRDPKVNKQIKRLDDYVEQILYFARAENAERDYLIKPVKLASVVGEVASRNREILQASNIDFSVANLDYQVYTDSKWLEFILNQILNNSIKYQSTAIHISARETDHEIILSVRDNGLGIKPQDLPRVFEKSFTGDNGRLGQKSTGMGLYIVKTLCDKLGHQIKIDSVEGEFTTVEIIFAKSEYYDVIDNTKQNNQKIKT